MIIASYIYPGWHSCKERDRNFAPGWSEWELVFQAKPAFPGHRQPRLPLDGPYDDSLPETAEKQVALALKYGIDLFVYGFFWSRSKRVFQDALDQGFLGSQAGKSFPFALMWANRMPRGVLPVKKRAQNVIDPSRLVYTDEDDFASLIKFVAQRYFSRPNYFTLEGKPLFSIFDSTFFIRQLGIKGAALAIARARLIVKKMGFQGLHLIAINPAPSFWEFYKQAGFDSVSHYVLLPEWKGPYLQDYRLLMEKRWRQWGDFQKKTALSYFPSVSPGWDASPRGVIHGGKPIKQYPWWPVVCGEEPEYFQYYLKKAILFSAQEHKEPLVFIASLNEWSEGHYLEPDKRVGTAWLEAVRTARDNG